MDQLAILERTLKDDIKTIVDYRNMLIPIVQDDRSWISQNLKEEADKNIIELNIRKSQLETVIEHIKIQISKMS